MLFMLYTELLWWTFGVELEVGVVRSRAGDDRPEEEADEQESGVVGKYP